MSAKSPRQPIIVGHYQLYMKDEDSAAFITRVSSRYTTSTLERLSMHASRQVRRAAILALGFVADFSSNTVLGRALVDRDRTVRTLAENGIRNVWCRDGGDIERQRLSIIVQLNASHQFAEAIDQAGRLIDSTPRLAEAWYQRAFAYYGTGRYSDALRDWNQTLEINSYHFSAAAGMGQSYLQLGDRKSALESFRRALKLNPNLEGVRASIAYLERLLRKNR